MGGGWIQKDGSRISSDTIFVGGVQTPIKDHFDTGVWIFALNDFQLLGCKQFFSQYSACITERADEDYSKTITFKYEKSIIRINIYYGKSDDPALKEVFEEILSTFRLLN